MLSVNKQLLIFSLLFVSIISSAQTAKEKAIAAITKAENAFSAMASEKGIQAAFTHFAAPGAIIKRGNDSLIYGNAGITNFYSNDVFKKAVLQWSPDFTDASESGELGYTYGKYTWQLKDDQGKIIQESKGIFFLYGKNRKMVPGSLCGINIDCYS